MRTRTEGHEQFNLITSSFFRMTEVVAPFGNFFRSLTLKTRIELADEKWEYTEEPHVERRKVRKRG